MARPRFVVAALSATAVAVVASILLLRPTGAEIGFAGEGESGRDAAIALDSVGLLEIHNAILAADGDFREGRADRRVDPLSERRAKRSVSYPPVGERGDVGGYLDPDAYPVSPVGGGVSDDFGEFQDPAYDLPSPQPYGGTLDIGDYLAPEEGP